MSRADASARIVEAAVALGIAQGVGALSLQGVATVAGVSKALVLYRFDGKEALLAALVERLVADDVAAMDRAAEAADALDAWRSVAGDTARRAERALLASLLQETGLRAQATAAQQRRAVAATRLASAMLRSAGLRPRIATALVGRVLLDQLDGLAAGGAPREREALDAELDALALSLLGLGS
ncbi:MAG TPA: helix-turn-helix domain-containing protein [Gemmatimonadaceae bacterium]|jgi:AcrR family transcriptional regulator|nr:helix-turn-helix domain-containing protein [Gemmatimonadaceae bacterium]HRQ77041.1 helix-turn-helix domain-containing protein [Gemmatimonadaceae bacterium]